MSSNSKQYINSYNKKAYKMIPFRVRKDHEEVLQKLKSVPSINGYINSLIEEDIHRTVLTIKEIKDKIRPVMEKHQIKEVYLFGSYSRGEATAKSDVDIFCDSGDIKGFIDQGFFEEELEEALGKKVDVIFTSARFNDFFKEQLEGDKIKLW